MSARHRRKREPSFQSTIGSFDVEAVANAIVRYRDENPEEYAAIVARNEITWAACSYDHSTPNTLCSKCGFSNHG